MADHSGKSARRQQILGSAEELLQHYGYAKTTVADIARQAGVGVGTVYLEFSSKDEIVAALAEHRHSSVLEAMQAVADGDGTYADRLTAMVQQRASHFMRYASEGQHGQDMVSCVCPAVGEVHARYRTDELELLSALLRQAHEAAEFVVCDVPRTARVVLLIMDQLMNDHPSYPPNAAERTRCTQLAIQLILDGLRQRPA